MKSNTEIKGASSFGGLYSENWLLVYTEGKCGSGFYAIEKSNSRDVQGLDIKVKP